MAQYLELKESIPKLKEHKRVLDKCAKELLRVKRVSKKLRYQYAEYARKRVFQAKHDWTENSFLRSIKKISHATEHKIHNLWNIELIKRVQEGRPT